MLHEAPAPLTDTLPAGTPLAPVSVTDTVFDWPRTSKLVLDEVIAATADPVDEKLAVALNAA